MHPSDTQRSRDIARAAQLYAAIHGALKAAPAPMSISELGEMTAIAQLYHKRLIPQKVHAQLKNLIKEKEVVKVGRGQYAINKNKVAPPAPAEQMLDRYFPKHQLDVTIDKSKKTLTFTFEGVQISIKVQE